MEQTTLSVKTWGQIFRDTIFGLVVGTTTSDGGGGPMMQLRLGYTSCRAQPTSVSYVAPPHKGLKSPKRFTNLPLGSMSSILNLMGLMHSYRSPGVPRTPRSYNALIEVFKFIWDVETPIRSDPYLSQSHQDWGLWTFSSKVAVCVPGCQLKLTLRRKLEKFHYLYVISRQLWHCLQRTWQKQVVCPGRLVESGLFFIKRSWAI